MYWQINLYFQVWSKELNRLTVIANLNTKLLFKHYNKHGYPNVLYNFVFKEETYEFRILPVA